jgi:hypothetical protein
VLGACSRRFGDRRSVLALLPDGKARGLLPGRDQVMRALARAGISSKNKRLHSSRENPRTFEPRHPGSYGIRSISTLPVASSRRCGSSVVSTDKGRLVRGGFGTFAVTMRTSIPDALAILCLDCILTYG